MNLTVKRFVSICFNKNLFYSMVIWIQRNIPFASFKSLNLVYILSVGHIHTSDLNVNISLQQN